ncbi:hypothetical protein JQV64_15455 [Sulfitobacter geojensis]|nr:hypothetical protein [Sulfitobacter geojensis]
MDGDTRKLGLVDPTPQGGIPHHGNPKTTLGLAVLPDNMPTRARREGAGPETFPQLDFHHLNAKALISERAKAVMEDMESNRHQFFPVEVTIGKDDAPYGLYFLFFLGTRLDTLDRDLSYPFSDSGICQGISKAPDGRVVLDSEKIGDHHMWAEQYVSCGQSIWLSDRMAERLEAEGLTGLRAFQEIEETKNL